MVVAQTEDDAAWEKPIRVQRTAPTSLARPAELAAVEVGLLEVAERRTDNDACAVVILEVGTRAADEIRQLA